MKTRQKTKVVGFKTSQTIAQQVGQRERRLARFLSSMSLAAAALPWTLGDQPQNRNEPQLNRAFDALSPFDAVSHARLRMTVGEALGTKHTSL